MGNLLSLNVSIHQRGTDAKKSGGGPNVHSYLEAVDVPLVQGSLKGIAFLNSVHVGELSGRVRKIVWANLIQG